MQTSTHGAAMAALSLCESILFSLTENKIISEAEAKGILMEAASAHREAARLNRSAGEDHAEAAKLLEVLVVDGDTVRLVDRLDQVDRTNPR